jgi:hypothetical protein
MALIRQPPYRLLRDEYGTITTVEWMRLRPGMWANEDIVTWCHRYVADISAYFAASECFQRLFEDSVRTKNPSLNFYIMSTYFFQHWKK